MESLILLGMLQKHRYEFHPVVKSDQPFEKIDLSKNNINFHQKIFGDIDIFSSYIHKIRKENNNALLFGGYLESRAMYQVNDLFEKTGTHRDLHLGIDIWGEAGTLVYAPLGGMVHSFAFNQAKGDYGATIILQHQLETINFYTLYGHLSLADIEKLRKGQFISRGENFAHFGKPAENGNWPPHLHFQLILDMCNLEGDYPGVCHSKEAWKYIANSPDPSFLLNI